MAVLSKTQFLQSSFSADDRQQALASFATQSDFDLVIIGGGINGAGTARDAALRGMKVALIEASDFSSGTSSRSSKLVHGGIRYLENLEFHLVFEALNERTKLFAMAPHLVHPLRFMIPLFEGDRVGMFKMGLGMALYDALSLWQAPELYERLSKSQTEKRMPALQPEKLKGSFVYSDAYMDDDRLTIETLRAAHASGAQCANYVKAVGALFDENQQVVGVKAVDQLTGQSLEIRGRRVVSCVGPWTDQLGGQFFRDWKNKLRPTKGVHLTFAKDRFPLPSAVVMAEKSRIVFAIPRHEMVIVGTTDTDYSGDPSQVQVTSEDVDYLIKVTAQYFPGAGLTRKDIQACYAGVRPLVHDGAETEGKTSREHTIYSDSHGVTYVMGGKYTTYRLISEQVVQEVLKFRSVEERVKFQHADSDQSLNPLISEETYAFREEHLSEVLELSTCSPDEALRLIERHGAEVEHMIQNRPHSSFWELEMRQAIDHSMCLNLLDFYTRRYPLMLAAPNHGLQYLSLVSKAFQTETGLSEIEMRKQEQEVLDYIKKSFDFLKG
jgi:glycerol-3-phosphate dehydrogenase